jgi:hypothetical protein
MFVNGVFVAIEMALFVTMHNLNSTETFLAWLIAVLAAMQLFGIFASMYNGADQYEFVPVEDGKIADYFQDGEPNEMLKDGWEVHLIATEGVLFKR